MKRIFSVLAALSCIIAINATTYTGPLKVVINGEATEQDNVQVELTQTSNGYTLTLKNFVLVSDDVKLPVGDIVLSNVAGIDEYGYTTIRFNDNIQITAGSDPAYGADEWIGPMLGDVPIDMTTRFTSTSLATSIDIDLSAVLGQTIQVSLYGIVPVIKGDVNEDNNVTVGDVNAVIDIMVTD